MRLIKFTADMTYFDEQGNVRHVFRDIFAENLSAAVEKASRAVHSLIQNDHLPIVDVFVYCPVE